MEVPLVLMPRKELGENVDVNEPFTVAMRRRGEAILKGVEVEGHGAGFQVAAPEHGTGSGATQTVVTLVRACVKCDSTVSLSVLITRTYGGR